jgi:hypothetical protein
VNFFDWINNHSFLAFVLVLCATSMCYAALAVARIVVRMVMVILRGWPPAHLDADGDWKPNPKKEGDK